jgi:anti-sigma factor (TIGR02949 family)
VRPIDRDQGEETFRRFDDDLDRELTPEEAALIQEHLEHCERCAREIRFEENVLRNVREKVRRVKAPAGLLDRITAALGGEG